MNTITRGRVLQPEKKTEGVGATPPYQAKEQQEQNRAPAAELQEKKLSALQGGGQPLPENIRPKLEAAFATDFRNVRLHHDTQSAALAEYLRAKAFTHREDIYFNQGEYRPGTAAGEKLLVHELTHVKQQRSIPGLQAKLQVPAERERYEQEADAVADKVVNTSVPTRAGRNHQSKISNPPAMTRSVPGDLQLAEENQGANWFIEKVGGFLRNIPGYDLLVLVIGRDPISGREVKPDGVSFVKAIVGLIPGGNLLFANLEKANVISRAVNWFKEEFQKLDLSYNTIKNLFHQAWNTLSKWDLLNPGQAYEKIKDIFTAPIRRVMNFITTAGPKLTEIIFEGALILANAPVKTIMDILNKGKGVLQQIITDPVGFLKNLINAIQGGLQNFLGKIGAYLQTGLAVWLFGALSKAGITMPEKLNLSGIFSLVAQVLGVTWQAIRTQVIKRLGSPAEKVMGQVEKSLAIVGALITKGPIALFETAKEFLGELQTRFFDSIIDWVRNTIIVKAVQKLLGMFNPVGAIIQAIIAIGDAVKFFVERAKQIAAFAGAVFDSITEIAAGNLKKAVAAVEDSLAKALPVAISFMANLVGIGGITAKIKEIIKKLRQPIDKAVGKMVGFVADKAKLFMAKITGAEKQKEEPPQNVSEHNAQVNAGLTALEGEQKKLDKNNNGALIYEEAEEAVRRVKRTYPVFKSITVVDGGDTWDYDYVASLGERKKGLKKEQDDPVKLEEDIVTRLSTHENAYLVKLGPYANTQNGSVMATSDECTKDEKRKIQEFGKIYGCHHTGNKNLDYYVPDHQAPTKLFELATSNKYVYDLLKKYGVRVHQKQRLFPQSESESRRQGGVVSTLSQKIKKLIKLRGE